MFNAVFSQHTCLFSKDYSENSLTIVPQFLRNTKILSTSVPITSRCSQRIRETLRNRLRFRARHISSNGFRDLGVVAIFFLSLKMMRGCSWSDDTGSLFVGDAADEVTVYLFLVKAEEGDNEETELCLIVGFCQVCSQLRTEIYKVSCTAQLSRCTLARLAR